MELNILEEKKGKLVFELKGATHTVANLLKKELWKNSHTKVSGYTVRHPLTPTPEFIVETDGEDPKKVVAQACQKIQKDIDKFAEEVKKEVK